MPVKIMWPFAWKKSANETMEGIEKVLEAADTLIPSRLSLNTALSLYSFIFAAAEWIYKYSHCL